MKKNTHARNSIGYLLIFVEWNALNKRETGENFKTSGTTDSLWWAKWPGCRLESFRWASRRFPWRTDVERRRRASWILRRTRRDQWQRPGRWMFDGADLYFEALVCWFAADDTWSSGIRYKEEKCPFWIEAKGDIPRLKEGSFPAGTWCFRGGCWSLRTASLRWRFPQKPTCAPPDRIRPESSWWCFRRFWR